MSRAQHLTSRDFSDEILGSSPPVLVDFYAPWCGPCRILGPAIDRMAQEVEGQAKVFKVNTEEAPELAGELGITGVPTLLFFKDGEVADRIVGLAPQQEPAAKLERLSGATAHV